MFSGSFTTYFTNGTIPDNFINEDEIAIALALTTNKTGNADFITITINRIKLTSADGDDPETGMKRTFNFQGLFNKVGGAALSTLATTIEMQDSLA
jgi:hypothetical protein